ncbi:MAG: Fur family transcriptional regulator [Anaerolineae bacterium]
MKEAEKALRNEGLRVTAQRALILDILRESDEHLDADDIYFRARRQDPKLSLSTVYRTLSILKEMGLVSQRYFARDHGREYYESSAAPEHYHFTCVSCGQIVEFETPLIEQLKRDLVMEHGVRFSYACICFEGYCAECAADPSERRLSTRGE